MKYLRHPLPGSGYLAICQELGLPPGSHVGAVLKEIRRLKMAAAEGPQKGAKFSKSVKDLKESA